MVINVDKPRGFELIGYKNEQVNGTINPYYISSSYATQLVVGDPVTKIGTSNLTPITQGSLYKIGILPEINRGAIGDDNPLIGIIVGFESLPDQEEQAEYNLANTERVAFVSDDPNALYRAQVDDFEADIGNIALGYNYIYDETADIVNGNSGAEINGSSGGGTLSTQQFKAERYENTSTNVIDTEHTHDPIFNHSKLIVSINNHQGVPNTLGI